MVARLDSREYKMSAFSERRRREGGIFFESEFLEEGEEKDVERTSWGRWEERGRRGNTFDLAPALERQYQMRGHGRRCPGGWRGEPEGVPQRDQGSGGSLRWPPRGGSAPGRSGGHLHQAALSDRSLD